MHNADMVMLNFHMYQYGNQIDMLMLILIYTNMESNRYVFNVHEKSIAFYRTILNPWRVSNLGSRNSISNGGHRSICHNGDDLNGRMISATL